MRTIAGAGTAVVLMMAVCAGQAPPQLPDVLARAAAFVAELESAVPVLAVEERYVQSSETTRNLGGSTIGATGPGVQMGAGSMIEGSMIRAKRATRSELLLVRRPAVPLTWSAVRNVLDIDGKPTGREPERLARLATDRAALEKEWTALTAEGQRIFIGPVERSLHVTLCALALLRADQQPRSAFTKDGEEKVRGTPAWRVKFVEQTGPSLLRTSGNVQVGSRGTFWIDPATGRVLRTRLEAGTGLTMEQLRVETEYAVDPALGVPLPVEAKEHYENQNGKVDVKVSYAGYRRIDLPK